MNESFGAVLFEDCVYLYYLRFDTESLSKFIINCAQQLRFHDLIRHRKRKALTTSGIFVSLQSKLLIGQGMDFQ